MVTASSLPTQMPARGVQFRLGTLLLAITWIGLICVALRTPTGFWAGTIVALTFLSLLASALLIIYRTGSMRAFAVGFLIFGSGYLACVLLNDRRFGEYDPDSSIPTTRAANWAYRWLHSHHTRAMLTNGMGGGMGGFGSGSTGGFGGGAGPTVIQVAIYRGERFVEVVQCATLTLLGIFGGVLGQWLHATRGRGMDERA